VAGAETELIIHALQFIDCSGDGVMAHLAGCEWRWGSESADETGEIHAPARASTDTMGNSIHFLTRDIGHPTSYRAPEWAMHYDDASFFKPSGRPLSSHEGGYWWIEIGVPWNTVHDNETIRHELTRHALGVWDYMKNRDPVMSKLCANRVLDFIGQVPGKRESRRIMGHHFLNENEIQERTHFADEVAYGGWFIDLHTPGGLLALSSEPAAALGRNPKLKEVAYKYVGPYGIPLGCLQSRDVPNLQMAGRNISTTHAALGTVRVMATCGMMGHAVGLAASRAVQGDGELTRVDVGAVQQALLRDGCFLPNTPNSDPDDLARHATVHGSSQHRFSGFGAWQIDHDRGLRDYMREQGYGTELKVEDDLCQWLFLEEGPLERFGVHLHHSGESVAEVKITLRQVESLWDYDKNRGEPLWQQVLEVTPGFDDLCWCQGPVTVPRTGAYRIEVEGSGEVTWRMTADHSWGMAAGFMIGSGRYKWRPHGKVAEFAFRLEPPQKIYSPEETLSGVSRPQTRTNAWFSDPSQAMPQHLELNWTEEQGISRVELQFAGQVVLEPRFEDPFYTPPHLPRRYRLEALNAGVWRTILVENENTGVHRFHDLGQTVKLDALKLVIDETHGGRSVGVVEIRCYA
jgi:hypothetical protein